MSRRQRRSSGRTALLMLLLVLAAVFVANMLPEIQKKRAYPVKYRDEICLAAQTYRLPPALVAAVACTESGYRPGAKSGAGALGMMQMLPDTARDVAKQLGESYTDDVLFHAEKALEYGCCYLRYLLDMFEGDERCAIAAYHGGLGNVRKWLNDPEYSPDGRSLAAFPKNASGTRYYVSKVEKAYEYYKKVYP